ncbi:hypothetical protein FSP39_007465 [Pinctada imbricata]|uniref:Ig-like domain-containing protein n=1 Tax=Pinctada imbricata TaxID=66713 RepID=A0AA88Y3P6_PINIB|nr:hypothetical protein FSP39_007465 [Pinctada imbricata]
MNPQHIVITKEDQKVIDDSRVSIERQYTQDWNLHIRNIQYRDEGTYKCIVNTEKPLIRHIYLSVRVPPHIDEASSSKSKIEVLEGRTVELNCNASGVPTPRIRWFRITTYDMGNKEEIMETNPWETLLIRNISRHCEGTYECVAHNNVKFSVSKTIQVIVVFRPEVSLTTKRLGQYMGKETVLQCRVSASPRTICAWERNGQELRTTMGKYRLTIYEDDPHSISLNLQIHELAPEDYGEYRCFASNSYGEDSETMVLYESRDEVLYTSTVTTTPRGSESEMEVLPPVSYDTPGTTGLEFVGGAHEDNMKTAYCCSITEKGRISSMTTLQTPSETNPQETDTD